MALFCLVERKYICGYSRTCDSIRYLACFFGVILLPPAGIRIHGGSSDLNCILLCNGKRKIVYQTACLYRSCKETDLGFIYTDSDCDGFGHKFCASFTFLWIFACLCISRRVGDDISYGLVYKPDRTWGAKYVS